MQSRTIHLNLEVPIDAFHEAIAAFQESLPQNGTLGDCDHSAAVLETEQGR